MSAGRDKAIIAIVNGAAGGGRCLDAARDAIASLRLRNAINVFQTKSPGHATDLAREHFESGHRRFISVGGDGTTFEVINGLFPNTDQSERVELGILPLGTGNSFLRDFGITSQERAIDALQRWETQPVDVVRAEHEDGVIHYVNLLGLGFTAEVGELTNRRFKGLGAAGYVAAVVSSLANLRAPLDPIRLDDEETDVRPAVFLSFSNSQYTGGAMHMAPGASLSDGLLDVVRVGEMSRASLISTFPKIYSGAHVEHPQVEVRRARRVEFLESRKQAVMVDGEIMHLALRSLEVLKGAVEVVR